MSTRAPDYFSVYPEQAIVLRTVVASWADTPFRQNSRVKGPGGGVDCASFVAACFEEIGAVSGVIVVPPYEVNHAEHSDESRLREWFERPEVRARVRLLDEDEPHLDGDMVFPLVGRCEHHLGLRIGPLVWHVVRPSGLCHMTVAQLKFHRSRYRLLVA